MISCHSWKRGIFPVPSGTGFVQRRAGTLPPIRFDVPESCAVRPPNSSDCSWYCHCLTSKYRCSERFTDFAVRQGGDFCRYLTDRCRGFSGPVQEWTDNARACLVSNLEPRVNSSVKDCQENEADNHGRSPGMSSVVNTGSIRVQQKSERICWMCPGWSRDPSLVGRACQESFVDALTCDDFNFQSSVTSAYNLTIRIYKIHSDKSGGDGGGGGWRWRRGYGLSECLQSCWFRWRRSWIGGVIRWNGRLTRCGSWEGISSASSCWSGKIKIHSVGMWVPFWPWRMQSNPCLSQSGAVISKLKSPKGWAGISSAKLSRPVRNWWTDCVMDRKRSPSLQTDPTVIRIMDQDREPTSAIWIRNTRPANGADAFPRIRRFNDSPEDGSVRKTIAV